MDTHDIAVGDRVRCIRTYDGSMKAGMEFTVIGVGVDRWAGWIAIDNGLCDPIPGGKSAWTGGYWHDRFEKVS